MIVLHHLIVTFFRSLRKLFWWLENILVKEFEVELFVLLKTEMNILLFGMHTRLSNKELSYPSTSELVGTFPDPVALVPSELYVKVKVHCEAFMQLTDVTAVPFQEGQLSTHTLLSKTLANDEV